MPHFDCIIVGVGGQGSVFASRMLGEAAVREGYEVISAETHGMAQRGGTVEVHVRLGSSYEPLIPLRTANVLVGMEPAECLRFARISLAYGNCYHQHASGTATRL